MFTYIGTDLDATSVLTLHDSFFVQICCSAASTTFLIYEYLITFDKEVEYFWMKRPNCGSVFFLFTRYAPLVIKAIDMSGYIHMSDKFRQVLILAMTSSTPTDLLVIALTWYTAYQAGVLRQPSPWSHPSFWWTFTRDGTVHFVAILTMNVLRLCFALRL
ncbi:hypothetical protein K466DRAFT_520929, partial [Polyporus arcularius HHB13444]